MVFFSVSSLLWLCDCGCRLQRNYYFTWCCYISFFLFVATPLQSVCWSCCNNVNVVTDPFKWYLLCCPTPTTRLQLVTNNLLGIVLGMEVLLLLYRFLTHLTFLAMTLFPVLSIGSKSQSQVSGKKLLIWASWIFAFFFLATVLRLPLNKKRHFFLKAKVRF